MNENIINPDQSAIAEEWEKAIETIDKYLASILYKIEWNYGEYRAPFVFPPKYEISEERKERTYKCLIKLEFSDDEVLCFTAKNPALLPQLIIDDFKKRFSFL